MSIEIAPHAAVTMQLYKEGAGSPQWCPGCGDFAALKVYITALSELTNPELFGKPSWEVMSTAHPLVLPDGYCQKTFIGVAPHTIVTDGGIGCMGQFPQYVNTYAVKMPHGRALPFVAGLGAMRPDITLFVVGGDGDAFAIGANHIVNFPGWGINVTYLVANNRVYGLTKGQAAPGTPLGMATKGAPYGTPKIPLNFLEIAIASGWTFVGRIAICGKTKNGFDTTRQAVEVLKQALVHPGPAIIIDESECPTYNKVMTAEYLREHVVSVEAIGPHSPSDKNAAYELAQVDGLPRNLIPTGVYYHIERESFHERLGIRESRMKGRSLEEAEKLLNMFA